MNTAVLGSGGREAAIAWKLRRDEPGASVFVLPGNAGIPGSVAIDPADPGAVIGFCREHGVGLVVVGPEALLAAGIVDALRAAGIDAFGPGAAAARLESSKAFAKEFMTRHRVATAASVTCAGTAEAGAALARFAGGGQGTGGHAGRVVVKYDGLAAGKGVFVCSSRAEAEEAIATVDRHFGAGSRIVLEELLEGTEVSVIGLTDGTTFRPLPIAQDHKRLLDGDDGPNTGGMGAVAPVSWLSGEVYARIGREIIEPTLAGIRAEGFDYRGFIYFGLMLTREGPRLLEYNVRLGDPETQVILPALGSSLAGAIRATLSGNLASAPLEGDGTSRAALVFAAGGYPDGPVHQPAPILGLGALAPETLVFTAGVEGPGGATAAGGASGVHHASLAGVPLAATKGRVLSVCVAGKDPDAALALLYAEAARLSFAGMQFRHDIGARWRDVPPEIGAWRRS